MRRENELALLTAEMRMVGLMCGVKLSDKLACAQLRDRLGLEDVVTVLQRDRLRWYGHVLRKDDSEWVKKCMEFVGEGVRPRGDQENMEGSSGGGYEEFEERLNDSLVT